jgi:1-acyl-sn-glycerol-3-phosphate acyltransferase
MFSTICSWILKLAGWKITHRVPGDMKRFVLIIAPHTSMWDFVWGWVILKSMRLDARFMIKKEMFWFPLGWILKGLGGLPVDRSQGSHLVHMVAETLSKSDHMVMAITPEATRKPNADWKKGFYRIALSAKLPVAVGYLDYAQKTTGIVSIFYPTGDFAADTRFLRDFYKDRKGKHPEKFLLPEWCSND